MKYAKQIGLFIMCLVPMHALKGMEEQKLPEKIKQEKKEKQETQFAIPIAVDSYGTDLVVFFRGQYDLTLKINRTGIDFSKLPSFYRTPYLAAHLNRGEDIAVELYKDIHRFMEAKHADQKCERDLIVVPLKYIVETTNLREVFVKSIDSDEDFKLDKSAYNDLLREHEPSLVGLRVGHFSGTDIALGKQRISPTIMSVLAAFQKEVQELKEAKPLNALNNH
jgi:hypothetical protein